jgi:hypothetical protein
MLCPSFGTKYLYFGWAGGGQYNQANVVLGNTYAINTRLIFPAGWQDGRNQTDSYGTDAGFGYVAPAQQSVQISSQIADPVNTALIADGAMAPPTWEIHSPRSSTRAAPSR